MQMDESALTKCLFFTSNRLSNVMEAQGYEEPAGQAKITPGYNLPARHVIHTVGPIVQGNLTKEHEELLGSWTSLYVWKARHLAMFPASLLSVFIRFVFVTAIVVGARMIHFMPCSVSCLYKE